MKLSSPFCRHSLYALCSPIFVNSFIVLTLHCFNKNASIKYSKKNSKQFFYFDFISIDGFRSHDCDDNIFLKCCRSSLQKFLSGIGNNRALWAEVSALKTIFPALLVMDLMFENILFTQKLVQRVTFL